MKFIKGMLNWITGKPNLNVNGYVNTNLTYSTTTGSLLPNVGTPINAMWDSIVNNHSERVCVHCDSFKPDSCNQCKKWKEYVLDNSPSKLHSESYLFHLNRYNQIKDDKNKDQLYSIEDYDSE